MFYSTVFIVDMVQGEADARAYGIYGAFNALLYAAPVIGGMIADKILGFRRTILLGGVCMALAQFILAANAGFVQSETMFFTGLGLLAVGNGFFKPNISSFLGTFYDKNDNRKDGAFTIFYMGINIGGMLGPIACGILGETVGWAYGFGAAAHFMIDLFWLYFKNPRGSFGMKIVSTFEGSNHFFIPGKRGRYA